MSFTDPSILQALRPRLPANHIARLATASRGTNLRNGDVAVGRVMTAMSTMSPDEICDVTRRLSQEIETRLAFPNSRQVACLQLDPILFNMTCGEVLDFIGMYQMNPIIYEGFFEMWTDSPAQARDDMRRWKRRLMEHNNMWYLAGTIAYGASPEIFRQWLLCTARSARNPAVLQLAAHIVADGG